MYVFDRSSILSALKKKGFSGVSDLSKFLGIHRNTLSEYLNNKRVFSRNFETVMEALDLKPIHIIKKEAAPLNEALVISANLIDELQLKNPQIAFILFGSRTKSKHHKYSDFDIGIYSAVGIKHKDYLQMRKLISEIAETSAFFVDLINLNNAEASFLEDIAKTWQFIGGSLKSWVELNKKVARNVS